MRIVINALPFKQQSSGIGILIYELFGALIRNSEQEFLTLLSQDSPPFGFDNGKAEECRIPYRKGDNLKRNLYQTLLMGRRHCKNAIFLTTDSKVPLAMPSSAIIVPVITDLAVFRMPEVYQRSRALYWKLQYRYLRGHAARYVAISECTKRDLMELCHVPEEKIDVIPCAASPNMKRVTDEQRLAAVRMKYNLPENYVLFVGNFNPRKNLERLLLAFDRFKAESGLPHELVIAGEHGWKFNQNSALAGIRYKDAVRFIGYAEEADMPSIYTMAALFVFPSLYEGFGIPIIEAQQCGAPVLAGNNSAMPEVGGAGAEYVDVYDIEAISCIMQNIIKSFNFRNKLIENGYKNASRFSWEASAKKLNDIIVRLG